MLESGICNQCMWRASKSWSRALFVLTRTLHRTSLSRSTALRERDKLESHVRGQSGKPCRLSEETDERDSLFLICYYILVHRYYKLLLLCKVHRERRGRVTIPIPNTKSNMLFRSLLIVLASVAKTAQGFSSIGRFLFDLEMLITWIARSIDGSSFAGSQR